MPISSSSSNSRSAFLAASSAAILSKYVTSSVSIARTANAFQTLGVPPEASNLAAYFAHTGGAGGKTTTMAQSEQTSSMPALRALDGLGI